MKRDAKRIKFYYIYMLFVNISCILHTYIIVITVVCKIFTNLIFVSLKKNLIGIKKGP